jgi:hypothetical protein
MMTCEVIQNRLLAVPNLARPTPELRAHLKGCPACRAVQARAIRIEAVVAGLPVPSSQARKEAFLDFLIADGPVIRSRPILPSSLGTSGPFAPVGSWLRQVDLRWVGGIAAALVVGLIGYAAFNRPAAKPTVLAEKPRHELLAKSVKHTTALANSRTASNRLLVFTDWSADFHAEACTMSNAAPTEDMNSLARRYEQTVNEGVLRQAKQLAEQPMAAVDRRQLLDTTIAKLAAAETEASQLLANARADAQPALGRIVQSAKQGRIILTRIAEGRDAS